MGRCIIKLTDGEQAWYLEWSSVVDAPVTYGMSRAEFEEYVREEYGNRGLEDLPRRMERVERTGTSSLEGATVDNLIAYNRAGPKETQYTKEQIIEHYCKRKPADEFEGNNGT